MPVWGAGTSQTYLNPGYTAYDSSTYGNIYDIEAMYFDNDGLYGYIALITGQGPTGFDWPIGDIGIDVTGTMADLYDGTTLKGQTRYEYAIDFNDTNASLESVTQWKNVYYDGTPNPDYTSSDPWEVNASSELTSVAYAWAEYNGDGSGVDLELWVYEFGFLLSDLGLEAGDEFNLHWTMKCGNDSINLTATVDPVPEPATMLLLGTGPDRPGRTGAQEDYQGLKNSTCSRRGEDEEITDRFLCVLAGVRLD